MPFDVIAWDGEGLAVPEGDAQPYVYLANSLGDCLIDMAGLDTHSILATLTRVSAQHPGAKHFIFGGSYDVNQWLRDVPETHLRKLWSTGRAWLPDYRIEYRPRRMFRAVDNRKGAAITLWDAFPFYQTSFVKALEKYLGKDYPDLPLIARMKAKRADFDAAQIEQIHEYTSAELRALVALVQNLQANFTEANIYPKRWDGPGAVAAALLQRHGIKEHKETTSDALKYPAAVAYSGGRIEALKYGVYDGTVYHYDIHSAYPHAMRDLPSLAGGIWEHKDYRERAASGVQRRRENLQPLANNVVLYHIRWDDAGFLSPPAFYPFPYRRQDGGIFYPPFGQGFVWGPEYAAWYDNRGRWPGLAVEVLETFAFTPASDAKPFAFVPELYTLREQWKREGNGAEYGLKLGLNSLYGKLAQTLGWNNDHEPPYYQLEWAGLITSQTRATLLRAAAPAMDSIIMFATDGIFSTEPLDLQTGEGLGEWEAVTHDGITVVQSGVYFLRDGVRITSFTRGYHFEKETPEETDNHRDERYHAAIVEAWRLGTDKIALTQDRFVTLGSALASPSCVSPYWRSWRNEPRELSLYPTGKRAVYDDTQSPATSLISSIPFCLPDGLAIPSKVYSRAWHDESTATVGDTRVEMWEHEVEDAHV